MHAAEHGADFRVAWPYGGIAFSQPELDERDRSHQASGSVLLTLFGGIGYTLLMGGGYFLLGFGIGATGYLRLLCSVNAALAAVLYLWLCKKGTALFAAL